MLQDTETSLDPEEDLLEAEEESTADEPRSARPVAWPLQIAKAERSIFELHRSWKNRVLRLDPDFQREFVWDSRRKVKLVESVLARIPLPVFYLSEENEEETLVIDGQQRLTTLFSFMDGGFELKGLELLPELNGHRFATLEGRAQRRFESTPLTCFIVQPGTSANVKFQIFERLNEGAIALNAQEIRNSLFRGPGLDLVKRLGADTSPGSFRAVAGAHRTYKRMRADELVLRALAFLDLGLDRYSGDTRTFLNEELQQLNRSPEGHPQLEGRLRSALARTRAVFGDRAFRRYIPADRTWARQLNGPLVEIIVAGFDRYFPEPKALEPGKAAEIRKRFEDLCGKAEFRDALMFATQSSSTVRRRFELWMKELADVA
jgi:hypothetical protein